jgi:hypothetical protein
MECKNYVGNCKQCYKEAIVVKKVDINRVIGPGYEDQ